MEKVYCLKCEKELHRSICMVENAGLVSIDFGMMSNFQGKSYKTYICDDCFEKIQSLVKKV